MLITVNGKQVDVAEEPDTMLLWVLRDNLKLTGTKFGCGICGTCPCFPSGCSRP